MKSTVTFAEQNLEAPAFLARQSEVSFAVPVEIADSHHPESTQRLSRKRSERTIALAHQKLHLALVRFGVIDPQASAGRGSHPR